MRFVLAQEHFDFFAKEQHIEFEGMVSEQDCLELYEKAEFILQKRLGKDKWENASNQERFLQGRNLHTDHLEIKKLCNKAHFAEIASLLFRKRPLRLAYDHYLTTAKTHDAPFQEAMSLQQISSFRPILGGVMILLKEAPYLSDDPSFAMFPKKRGHVVFFSGQLAFDFPKLFQQEDLVLFILAFTGEKVIYCLESKDPFTHVLKKQGYAFGDAVKEDQCPVLYR